MATKKQHNFVSAETGQVVKPAKPVGNAGGLRAGAVVLWLFAIVCEVLGILVLIGKINLKFCPTMWQLIGFIVLDLIFVIIGSTLWKKANHIDPASKKDKLKFWLWNNMGLIVCCFAFIPYVVLLLSDKHLDKKTKAIATVVAVIAALIGGVASYDFNPVSAEEKQAAVTALGENQVVWTPYGHVYHTHEDCNALNQTDTLTIGTVEQAIAANRTRLCKFCANKDEITGVVTDED